MNGLTTAQTSALVRWLPSPPVHSLPTREISVELLRFLAMLQPPFFQLPRLGIHCRNLLEPRVIVTTYNLHVRLLLPEPWLLRTTKVYSGLGRRHCHGINYTQNRIVSEMAMLH